MVRLVMMFMTLMRCLNREYVSGVKQREGPNAKLGIFRFSSRNSRWHSYDVYLPSQGDLDLTIELRAFVCLSIWKLHPKRPPLKSMTHVYNSLKSVFGDTSLKGNGPLGCKHELAILSSLGVLPPWIRTYAPIEEKNLERLSVEFKCVNWKDGQRSTMAHIARNLKIRGCGDDWTLSMVENFLCKYLRANTGTNSDGQYYDIHRKDEFTMVFNDAVESDTDATLSVMFMNKKAIDCDGGVLFHRWSFDNQRLTALEIANRMEDRPKDLSTVSQYKRSLHKFQPLKQLFPLRSSDDVFPNKFVN